MTRGWGFEIVNESMSARNQFFLHKKLSIKNLINICLILFLILGVFVISYYVKNNKKILKSKAEQIQYCSASKYCAGGNLWNYSGNFSVGTEGCGSDRHWYRCQSDGSWFDFSYSVAKEYLNSDFINDRSDCNSLGPNLKHICINSWNIVKEKAPDNRDLIRCDNDTMSLNQYNDKRCIPISPSSPPIPPVEEPDSIYLCSGSCLYSGDSGQTNPQNCGAWGKDTAEGSCNPGGFCCKDRSVVRPPEPSCTLNVSGADKTVLYRKGDKGMLSVGVSPKNGSVQFVKFSIVKPSLSKVLTLTSKKILEFKDASAPYGVEINADNFGSAELLVTASVSGPGGYGSCKYTSPRITVK
ncbi:hypothetical protein A2382_04050 [Candidatus Woesebacteria bacterium RIFOXYB1_FULL_38_16]|uniref:Uncharacterized protein n=1 Tax=Candidatus Woesebacteria bacterium RIFOXYB1_FULL_38_16 TaxID=1802538 RepID=A0A1F8CR24_9BACT|nr:MAG: hypothetical protein A2191_02350 [Candidatus Woesebacteria bacterium RIFOXYA1_FULL_38_9]OGM78711.1 MAG: hypothetical protein A2382_04050 [Candidatus Woesebacteria bacterium RIFOXYB1_FULL_38_16]